MTVAPLSFIHGIPMQNVISFPSEKRDRQDIHALDFPAVPEELDVVALLTSNRELLVGATAYLEALSKSLKRTIDAVQHDTMRAHLQAEITSPIRDAPRGASTPSTIFGERSSNTRDCTSHRDEVDNC